MGVKANSSSDCEKGNLEVIRARAVFFFVILMAHTYLLHYYSESRINRKLKIGKKNKVTDLKPCVAVKVCRFEFNFRLIRVSSEIDKNQKSQIRVLYWK